MCYLQQHEEGTQQHDNCLKTAVVNFRLFSRVVAFFIINDLKKQVMLPKYRKEFITPQNW
jgi:hypothetical protein